jgi:hypothetical protein
LLLLCLPVCSPLSLALSSPCLSLLLLYCSLSSFPAPPFLSFAFVLFLHFNSPLPYFIHYLPLGFASVIASCVFPGLTASPFGFYIGLFLTSPIKAPLHPLRLCVGSILILSQPACRFTLWALHRLTNFGTQSTVTPLHPFGLCIGFFLFPCLMSSLAPRFCIISSQVLA